MRTASSFANHCLDVFSGLGPVVARAMFGGYGFYLGRAMFAIGDAEEWRIWLKVDEHTHERFEEAGGDPFTYSSKGGRTTTLSFVTPPDSAMEDADAMLAWARLALEAAERALAKRSAKRAASPKPEGKMEGKLDAKKRATPRRRAARR